MTQKTKPKQNLCICFYNGDTPHSQKKRHILLRQYLNEVTATSLILPCRVSRSDFIPYVFISQKAVNKKLELVGKRMGACSKYSFNKTEREAELLIPPDASHLHTYSGTLFFMSQLYSLK